MLAKLKLELNMKKFDACVKLIGLNLFSYVLKKNFRYLEDPSIIKRKILRN